MAGAPPKGGLSLYDNLLDPEDKSSSATISSAPVLYNQGSAAAVADNAPQKLVNPALRFQPIRRPVAKQPSKPKAAFPKSIPKPPEHVEASEAAVAAATAPAQPARTTAADWAATEEDEWRYGSGEKRQRGGRKKKKRRQEVQTETDWDELYDPSRPTNVEEYLRSDEKVAEVREWKALLYRHKKNDESDMSEDEDSRPILDNKFAPPSSYNFAPPPPQSPPIKPPAPPPDNDTSDDAYGRRPSIPQDRSPPPPPPPEHTTSISAAPILYNQTPYAAQGDSDDAYKSTSGLGQHSEAPENAEPRSSRPGQAGFAHRLMSKYGWAKGSGLGASSTGIINPLQVKVDKRRKKADADGGGWAEPGGKGTIVGGKRKGEEKSKFGPMSEVIVLKNMLENLPDLAAEISDGLGQEIGEECGEKYGRVERIYIDQENRQVFIKFTDQVSALRAVNELDGRIFNGNAIIPRFYDNERFGKGIYE
ncbi:hypothetical protein N3K66_004699 [Trichothecium roseum]|uniref:Uncharacterized protein n=1 Tax=Trichothecium roseum TaxID=47278 RepID=A0ACC0V2C3_9HYPO|nr:hypothetical protein N3K66_004699 [Trichothecium roseum]